MDNNPVATAAQHSPEKTRITAEDAFGIGADAMNRIEVMINAAHQIASSPLAEGHTAAFLAGFLQEARNLAEDLAGLFEHQRDGAAMLEGKR